MVKVVEEGEQDNQALVDKSIGKPPKKQKGKKKGKANQENEDQNLTNEDQSQKNEQDQKADENNQNEQKQKSNAGRPKKNNVVIENLDFSYSTSSYNISAFSVQFRKFVMCHGKEDSSFNNKFVKYGKKNNKSYFTEKVLEELKEKINSKKDELTEVEKRLYSFCENIKLQIYEYYDNDNEQRELESSILDELYVKMSKETDYIFNAADFPNIEKSQVILPFFWENIANIMQYEKDNKIDKNFLELLD